jgi:hypothetical protein
MKKYIKNLIIVFSLAAILVMPYYVLAASQALDNLQNVGERGNNPSYQTTNEYTMSYIVGLVIQAFLSLLGVMFLSYMLYAGFNWMSAQGDEEKVTKAKETIQRAIIGLIVTIAAYAISYWVFDRLLNSTNIIN